MSHPLHALLTMLSSHSSQSYSDLFGIPNTYASDVSVEYKSYG
jgi:hypothetical protein